MAAKLAEELARMVGSEAVLDRFEDLMLYEYDGSVERALPQAVVFPTTTEQVRRRCGGPGLIGFGVLPDEENPGD